MNNEHNDQKEVGSKTAMRRLYRSQRQKMIGGVCGGLSEYFKIDPTLVRIAFVILAFAGGWGIIGYIIGLIVIPENPERVIDPGRSPFPHPPGSSASLSSVRRNTA